MSYLNWQPFIITFLRTACNYSCCISGNRCRKWWNRNFCQWWKVSLKVCLFYRLHTKWWKPEIMNLRKKKGGGGKVKEKEPYCPGVTFPFPCLLWFVNQDMGMQELNNRNLQPFWLASLPLPPLPPLPPPYPPSTLLFQAVDLSMY